MPKIPRANVASQSLSTTTPSEQSPGAFTRSLEAVQDVGRAALTLADYYRDLRNFREITQAQTQASNVLRTIQTEAALDTDPDNEMSYYQRIQDFKETAAQGISDEIEALKFRAKLEQDTVMAGLKIRNIFNSKKVDAGKASLVEYVAARREDYFNAVTEKERELILDELDDRIDSSINAGFINRETGANLKIKTKDSWRELEFQRDLYGDPQNGIEANPDLAKKKLEEGVYKFGVEDRLSAQAEIEKVSLREEKRIAQKIKEEQFAEAVALGEQLREGAKGYLDVIQGEIDGTISPKMALVYREWLQSDKPFSPDLTDKDIYMELINSGLDLDATLDTFTEKVYEAETKGDISFKDATDLLGLVTNDFQNAKDKEKRIKRMQAVVKGMQSTFTIGLAYNMTRDFMNRIMTDNPPADEIENIGKEIVTDYQKADNPNRAKYEIGDIIPVPATGKSYKVIGFYDDGEPNVEELR